MGRTKRLGAVASTIVDARQRRRRPCRICQLDGRLVNPEKELVLLKQGQGLSPSSRWVCVEMYRISMAVALVLGTIFWCCWQVLSVSHHGVIKIFGGIA